MTRKNKQRYGLKSFGGIAIALIFGIIGTKLIFTTHASQLAGDANGDGVVNIVDLSILASNWGTTSGATWSMGDFNGDGMVNVLDLSILADHWGDTLTGLPTIPSGLSATPASDATVNLSWTADSSTNGTVTYSIYRNGSQVGTTTNTTYSDTGLISNTAYSYTISAKNNNGTSDQSSSVNVTTLSSGSCSAPSGTFTIAICGNKFVNQSGQTVVLRGANTEGTQYDCAQSGAGFYDDTTITPGAGGNPGNYTTEVNALKVWGINVVRVNLNEECWLGINGVPSTTSATVGTVPAGDSYDTKVNAYMTEMGNYVKALNAAGIYTELDLHLNAPGAEIITDASTDAQNPLPEANSDNFWKSVAAYFNQNHSVIFGVFNEPFPPNAKASGDTTSGWACVLSGCTVPDYTNEDASKYGSTVPLATYSGEGMQQMINDIRDYNTTAPLLVGGPDFAGDMDNWLSTFYPAGKSIDPDNELAASVHIYYPSGNSPCSLTTSVSTACPSTSQGALSNNGIMQVAAITPVEIDELGDFTCTSNESASTSLAPFIQSVDTADTTDSDDIGYIGWSWTTYGCDPNLITNFTTGAPSNMGEAFYCELLNGVKVAQSTFSSDCTGDSPK